MADKVVGVTTPENMRELLRHMRWLKNHWSLTAQKSEIPPHFIPAEPEQIYFRNDSGFEVPRYGCMKIVSTVEADGQNYITIERPDGSDGDFLLNFHDAVPANEYGIAQNGPVFRMVTDGSSQVTWGPDTDAFTVTAGSKWTHIGPDDIAADVVKAVEADEDTTPQVYVAITTSTITGINADEPGTGTVDVETTLDAPPDLTAVSPALSLTVYNIGAAIASGQHVIVVRDDIDQKWWVIPKGGSASPRVRGTIKNVSGTALFEEPTGVDPHTIENIIGIDAVWTGAATLEVTNPIGHKLWYGPQTCNVAVEFNATTGDWEVYSAQADKIIHRVKRDTEICKFMELDGEAGWHNWEEGANAKWVKEVFFDGGDCSLYYNEECNEDSVFITKLDFVDTIRQTDCGFEYAKNCDDEATEIVFDFVTDVIYSSGSCELFVYRCDGTIDSYGLDFVTSIAYSECSIVATKCDGTTSVAELPNFVTDVGYNAADCKVYVQKCAEGSTNRSFYLDFVKDVEVSEGGCHVIVTKCEGEPDVYDLGFVLSVYPKSDGLYYRNCEEERLIIEFTDCPPPIV